MVQTKKRELRRDMRTVLSNLDQRWITAAHLEVCAHLTDFVGRKFPRERKLSAVLAWIPSFPGEVDLSSFIASMLRRTAVFLPRIVNQEEMEFVRIDQDWVTKLEQVDGRFFQPNDEHKEVFDQLDAGTTLVIVPGLAFDKQGNRLGRGKGHYDRYLSKCDSNTTTTVAACWSMQLVPNVPTDQFDLPINALCHENGIEEITIPE